MSRKTSLSALVASLLLGLPAVARCDSITYTFVSSDAHFSFTEPALLTTNQILTISPINLQGATFVHASVAFFMNGGQNEACFEFGTANVHGNCVNSSVTAPFSEFDVGFFNATSVGKYSSFLQGMFAFRPPH
jgi:hypothetical protein